MTLTFKLDLDRVKVNQHAKYLGQRSFNPEVIDRTHTYTHINPTEHSSWTTKVMSN